MGWNANAIRYFGSTVAFLFSWPTAKKHPEQDPQICAVCQTFQSDEIPPRAVPPYGAIIRIDISPAHCLSKA